jgi:branched-chain amino acid transport system ATP-binding protein
VTGKEAVLDVGSLSVFSERRRLINNVSTSFSRSEVVFIVGPNGSGKTTFLNALTGFAKSSGVVALEGVDVSSWNAFRRTRAGIRRSFQGALILAYLTVRENLCVALAKGRVGGAYANLGDGAQSTLEEWLDLIELSALGSTLAGDLSFGQRKFLALAMAAIVPSKVLLLDEPTAGLSPRMTEKVLGIVQSSSSAVIIVEHNTEFIRCAGGRALLMTSGCVTLDASVDEVMSSDELRAAYR